MLTLNIPGDHPALVDHFPGNPIVPGVVILDHIIEMSRSCGYTVEGIANVKFSAPLKPDSTCLLEIATGRSGANFTLSRNSHVLVSGTLVGRTTD